VADKPKGRVPAMLHDVVMDGLDACQRGGVRVAQDGLMHQFENFDVWRDTFHGNQSVDRETFENVTCVTCISRMLCFTR
jgi:hypothetical protein